MRLPANVLVKTIWSQKSVPCDESGNSQNGVVESGQHALRLLDVGFTLT